MKKRKSIFLVSLVLVSALLLSACGGGKTAASSQADAAGTIKLKIGASPAPHAEILEQVKPILEQQGIELEIIEFSDYVLPNTALNDGDIDANYFQHKPYLDDFNTEKGMELVSAAAIHFEPLGIYPGKTQSLEELPEGAKIGIPNDTTNQARALYLLEAEGLITIKEGAGFQATPADVEENPNNYSFVELEAAQVPSSLPDLDIGVVNGNYAVGSGIAETVLVTEAKDSEAAQTYANIVAVRKGDENRPEIKALVEALKSEEVRKFIDEKYNGVVVTVF